MLTFQSRVDTFSVSGAKADAFSSEAAASELFQIKITALSPSCEEEDCLNCERLENKFFFKNPLKKTATQHLKAAHFDCNWGRIVGLFAFSGCLAIKCYEKRIPGLVYDIINWLVQLLSEDDYKISYWIESKGNWVG